VHNGTGSPEHMSGKNEEARKESITIIAAKNEKQKIHG
jgi:hypothetical protein